MNNKFVVYTSLFGDYDTLIEPNFVDNECDYICFTDQEKISSNFWNVIHTKHDEDPVLMNRKYKMFPHVYLSNYKMSLYVDANIILKKGMVDLFIKYLNTDSIVFPKHFSRDCIYDEARFCLKNHKVSQAEYDNIVNNMLLNNGFPQNIGLAENNILLRNHNDLGLNNAMQIWWDCFNFYARRDQLSLMYVLWQCNIKFGFMKESSRNKNSFFDYQLHKRYQEKIFIKRALLSISARRERNLFYKWASKLIDKL